MKALMCDQEPRAHASTLGHRMCGSFTRRQLVEFNAASWHGAFLSTHARSGMLCHQWRATVVYNMLSHCRAWKADDAVYLGADEVRRGWSRTNCRTTGCASSSMPDALCFACRFCAVCQAMA